MCFVNVLSMFLQEIVKIYPENHYFKKFWNPKNLKSYKHENEPVWAIYITCLSSNYNVHR